VTELPDDAVARLHLMREAYAGAHLLEEDLASDPWQQFAVWLDEALAAGLPEPNAMVLATADADGIVSARTVLLKGVEGGGFTFFTNRGSRKARSLAANHHASLVFPWFSMLRQVVVVGEAVELGRAESAEYFGTRPYGSRISAWASPQSHVVPSRAPLEARYAEYEERYPNRGLPDDVPLPDTWGGFRVRPQSVEFWQGRPSRMHDRLRYHRDSRSAGGWTVERLAP